MGDLLVYVSLLVIHPSGPRVLNVPLLSLLCSASKQDHDTLPAFSEINAEARTEIDSVLVNAAANALHVGEVALRQSRDCYSDLGCGLCGQAFELLRVRAAAVPVEVFENLDPVEWYHIRYLCQEPDNGPCRQPSQGLNYEDTAEVETSAHDRREGLGDINRNLAASLLHTSPCKLPLGWIWCR
jgi:hypothetical protein